MSETACPASSATANEKELRLRTLMRGMGSVLVAYSGGVDSTYLAAVATAELGRKAMSVLGLSPSVSQYQRDQAEQAAYHLGLNFETILTDELGDERYASNPANRCFFCKSELYSKLSAMAASRDLGVVLDGTNFDDLSGHRPGRDAAERAAVRSPLAELGFTKEDIRTQSRKLGIKGWDKPASPCLASRVAYGVEVTVDRLAKVERGEDFLRQLGFREFRVRSYQDTARVEIAKRELDNSNLSESWPAIENELRRIGFESVSLDPQGFRSGSMNVGVV